MPWAGWSRNDRHRDQWPKGVIPKGAGRQVWGPHERSEAPIVYSTGQVAKALHCHQATVLNLIRRGMLEAMATPGGLFRVSLEAVEKFLKSPQNLKWLARANAEQPATPTDGLDPKPAGPSR